MFEFFRNGQNKLSPGSQQEIIRSRKSHEKIKNLSLLTVNGGELRAEGARSSTEENERYTGGDIRSEAVKPNSAVSSNIFTAVFRICIKLGNICCNIWILFWLKLIYAASVTPDILERCPCSNSPTESRATASENQTSLRQSQTPIKLTSSKGRASSHSRSSPEN